MANRAALLFAALCWAASGYAHADTLQPNADEREILEEFSNMAALARPLGIAFETLVADDAQEGNSPMAMGFDAGTCTLVVRIRNNPLYKALVMAQDGHSKALKLRAILAHEMGHCFRHYFRQGDMEPAQPVSARARMRARRESEVQADRFALAWTAIYRSEDYDGVLEYLQKMRSTLCVDRAGGYARPGELTDSASYKGGTGEQAAAELLMQIATLHAPERDEQPGLTKR
jgi:hypothetical protein